MFVPLGVTVEDAVNLMREHDISQVPVIEGGEVVGSISEARILDILVSDAAARGKPVAEYMEKPFPVVSDDASLTEVAQQMDRETSAVLVKQNGWLRHHYEVRSDFLPDAERTERRASVRRPFSSIERVL